MSILASRRAFAFVPAACVTILVLLFFFKTNSPVRFGSPKFEPEYEQPSQSPQREPGHELQSPTPPTQPTHPTQPTQPTETPHPTQQEPEQTPSPSAQPDAPKCGVTKVSMLYGSHKFSQLENALLSHKRHTERWGCKFEELEYDLTTGRLFSKQYFVMSTMLQELAKPEEERQQWLMWVDADSIVLNPALSPEVFLPPDHLKDVYALVTGDQNGLNAGVFYLRVHPSSLDLLTQAVDYPAAHPDEDLGWFGEQAAMANVIKSIEASPKKTTTYPGIVWVPRIWFNAYQFEHGFEGEPGNAMVHFAGMGETRLGHMQEWLDELQQNQTKWEKPLNETFYETAIPEFWKDFEANKTSQV